MAGPTTACKHRDVADFKPQRGTIESSRQPSKRKWMLGCLVVLMLGCGASGQYIWVGDYVRQGMANMGRPIRPGDRLQIVIQGHDNLGATADVRPDGEVVLPVVGSVPAASKTPTELANAIATRLTNVVNSPSVTVVVERRRTVVTVIGEVRTSGRHELEPREGVMQVLARAGGLTPFADEQAIFVLRREPRPARIRFSFKDLAVGDPASSTFELHDGDTVLVE